MSSVVLLAPAGQTSGTVHASGVPAVNVGADGTVTVDSTVVKELLAAGFTYPATPAFPTQAIASGTVNYTSPAPFCVLTGTLTGNVTLSLPNSAGVRQFDVGALVMSTFSLTFNAGSGNSVALTSSSIGSTQTSHQLVTVITEGNNIVRITY